MPPPRRRRISAESPGRKGRRLISARSKVPWIFGGSSGTGQDSPGDCPVVQLRTVEGERTLFLPPASWSSTAFASVPVPDFPKGYAMATVFVNGIPSTSAIVSIGQAPTPLPFVLVNPVQLLNGTIQFTFTNVPGVSFTVLGAPDVSLPLNNWTVLGPAVEVAPGQFQFTDPQPATTGQEFYRVRSP